MHHVIGPPGPSQFHSFVATAPTLYDNDTNLWIRLSLLSLNLVGVDPMPLDLRHSSQARCTIETCLLTFTSLPSAHDLGGENPYIDTKDVLRLLIVGDSAVRLLVTLGARSAW